MRKILHSTFRQIAEFTDSTVSLKVICFYYAWFACFA